MPVLTPPADRRDWLTRAEVAKRYGCHVRTVSRMARRREIPFMRFGHEYRFPVSALRLLEQGLLQGSAA